MFWNNVYGAMQHLKTFVTELPNGELVINATPHNLVFEGEISVAPCGYSLLAKSEYTVLATNENGVEEVVTSYIPSDEGLTELNFIELLNREYTKPIRVIGSILSANAYKGRVSAPIIVEGLERADNTLKRCYMNKFVCFTEPKKAVEETPLQYKVRTMCEEKPIIKGETPIEYTTRISN